jgi:hypothetical protein
MVRYALAFPARIDRRRPPDGVEASAIEGALSHEIGQAKHGKLDAVHPRRDADQGVGNHGRNDPQADRVLIITDESADAQVRSSACDEERGP